MDAIPTVAPLYQQSLPKRKDGEALSGDTMSLVSNFINLYHPESTTASPTKFQTLSVRMGLNRDGLKKLMSFGKVLTPIEYEEHFFNWENMKKNRWQKQVTFLMPNGSNDCYIVNTEPIEDGSVGEYIFYIAEHPQDVQNKDLVATFHIKRTTVTENIDSPTCGTRTLMRSRFEMEILIVFAPLYWKRILQL